MTKHHQEAQKTLTISLIGDESSVKKDDLSAIWTKAVEGYFADESAVVPMTFLPLKDAKSGNQTGFIMLFNNEASRSVFNTHLLNSIVSSGKTGLCSIVQDIPFAFREYPHFTIPHG